MNHEQKPESTEFRAREAQVEEIMGAFRGVTHVDGGQFLTHMRKRDLETALKEAEVRGAAEQRRKDAEGAEPVGYVRPDMMEFFRQSKALFSSASIIPKRDETHTEALYTRPANVAALEARVKELEGERVKAVSRLRSQIVGYRKTQHSRIAKSLARTLHVVYGETYRDSDFEHVAVVEDMLRERAEAAERRIAEDVAAERERCAKALDKVAKQLAGMLGGHLTEEGIAIKEACAARVEQEAAAIREGGK